MVADLINEIKEDIKKFDFFEFSILSFDNDNLTIAGSEDFSYFHNVELKFHNVQAIACRTYFKVDTKSNFLSIADANEAFEVNTKYDVLIGNVIFKFQSEDGQLFYIAAKDLTFKIEVVRY